MTYGAAIFLIAVGAIMRFAVTARVAGIDLATVGLILIGAGAIGIVIGLLQTLSGRTAKTVVATSGPGGDRITETRQEIR